MGRWWFVRHGESTANAEGWLAGHHDAPLTARGVAQAEALQPSLASLSPQRVLSSDLQRAWRTAELAWGAREPAIEQVEALRERHLGDWEQRTRASLRARGEMPVLLTWDEGPPDGESQLALSRRVLTWLAGHDDGRDTLLFAHGGLIRCVVGLLDDTPRGAIGRHRVDNTQVIERQVARGTWRLLLASL
jgi:broad specificity phosphatase PhoE